MNKGLKKGLKITGVTVAVILVFMLVLPFVFKDKVITIVKKEANEMLNAKLDFESLISVSFRISRVRLSN